MRKILWAALLLPLGGCALPPALSIASLVMDAGSYAASGKSMTDHGISLVAERDCALLNLLSEGALCRDTPSYETAVAELEPLPGTAPGDSVKSASVESASVESASVESASVASASVASASLEASTGGFASLPYLSDGLPRDGAALRPALPAGAPLLAGGAPAVGPPSTARDG